MPPKKDPKNKQPLSLMVETEDGDSHDIFEYIKNNPYFPRFAAGKLTEEEKYAKDRLHQAIAHGDFENEIFKNENIDGFLVTLPAEKAITLNQFGTLFTFVMILREYSNSLLGSKGREKHTEFSKNQPLLLPLIETNSQGEKKLTKIGNHYVYAGSDSLLKRLLFRMDPAYMQDRYLFGSIKSLLPLHKQDTHLIQIGSLYVKSTPHGLPEHDYYYTPWPAQMIHDRFHQFAATLLGRVDRRFIFDLFIPWMKTMEKIALNYHMGNLANLLNRSVFHANDFNLPVQHEIQIKEYFIDPSVRIKHYLEFVVERARSDLSEMPLNELELLMDKFFVLMLMLANISELKEDHRHALLNVSYKIRVKQFKFLSDLVSSLCDQYPLDDKKSLSSKCILKYPDMQELVNSLTNSGEFDQWLNEVTKYRQQFIEENFSSMPETSRLINQFSSINFYKPTITVLPEQSLQESGKYTLV